VRATLYILLPLALVVALILVSQGVVQNFDALRAGDDPGRRVPTLAQGPAASQIAIKQLGTNGGGFFNANSAHPYENPTPLSNFLQMFAASCSSRGADQHLRPLVGATRQGWAIFAAMLILFAPASGGCCWPRLAPIPSSGRGRSTWRARRRASAWPTAYSGPAATTAASNGSVNAMLSSFSPLAGGVALLNILLGEVIFGGVGAGLYGMLVFVILTVFIAGLMVGPHARIPGQKDRSPRGQAGLPGHPAAGSASILLLTRAGRCVEAGLSSRTNLGPHG
jgi:K+-transporting ATPase ATPase A chain